MTASCISIALFLHEILCPNTTRTHTLYRKPDFGFAAPTVSSPRHFAMSGLSALRVQTSWSIVRAVVVRQTSSRRTKPDAPAGQAEAGKLHRWMATYGNQRTRIASHVP